MAKVKGPLFSIIAIGKIDNKLIYRDRKIGPDVKKYTKTINPNSAAQQDQKSYFKNAIEAWSIDGYSVADKWAWDQYAKTKKVIASGFNYFSGFKMTSELVGNTWNKLTNVTIYDVTLAGFKVDVNVASDLSGVLYLGISKYSMLQEFVGVFNVDKYTFTITGLPDETKVYFYIKNTSVGESARTGIYSQYNVGGFVPEPIDIGWLPGSRSGTGSALYTYIVLDNPANGSGLITTVKIRAYAPMENCKVAIFFNVGGNNYSTRSVSGNLGTISGIMEKEVNLAVQTGDLIGFYFTNGTFWRGTPASLGSMSKAGDYLPCTNETFTLYSAILAPYLFGEGTTAQ